MSLSQAGQDAVEFILNQIESGVMLLPTEIDLERIGKSIGVSNQVLGSAFKDYIEKPLAAKGIAARKCGVPRRIQLRKV